MLADNALIRLDPPPSETASGIAIVHTRAPGVREHREAIVIAVGPGHHPGCKSCGGQKPTFIPTTLKPGDRIVVDATAGQRWDFDVSATRSRDATEFDAFDGDRAQWRVIREAEAHCVIESDAQAAE